METLDRYMALIMWMLALLVITIFVTSARTGAIHDAAWHDACRTLETGGAIPGNWNATNHCED